MKKTMLTSIAALVILGLGASATAIAASPSQFDDSSVSVSFADLNIQNSAGAKVLYSRLQQASESVCNVESYRELGSLARVAQAQACYTETLDNAVAKIDSAALQAIHSS
jgi:UrcA family protein